MTNTEEEELIKDILTYLPDWQVTNKNPQQNLPHKTQKHPEHKTPQHCNHEDTQQYAGRHTPPPHNHEHHIEPFIQPNDLHTLNKRKTINKTEILQHYRIAYNQILSHTNRTRLPINPIIHEALCMWTAGLLEKKYKFKQTHTEDEHYYTLNLTKEAKTLLEPYIRSYFKVLKTSDCPESDRHTCGRLH